MAARQNPAVLHPDAGMGVIKKTVNQDDTSIYHLFYGDDVASRHADLRRLGRSRSCFYNRGFGKR